MTPVDGWEDADMRLTGIQSLEVDDLFTDYVDQLTAEIHIEINSSFYAGVMYGMALEAGKDGDLERRLSERGLL